MQIAVLLEQISAIWKRDLDNARFNQGKPRADQLHDRLSREAVCDVSSERWIQRVHQSRLFENCNRVGPVDRHSQVMEGGTSNRSFRGPVHPLGHVRMKGGVWLHGKPDRSD